MKFLKEYSNYAVEHLYNKPSSKKAKSKLKTLILSCIYIIVIIFFIKFLNTKYLSNAYAKNKYIVGEHKSNKKEKIKVDKFKATREKLIIEYYSDIIGNKQIASHVIKYSKLNDIDASLLAAVINVESSFNPKAVNKNKNGSMDRGLCQLNNKTFKNLSVNEFYNPETNIKHGANFLKWCTVESKNNVVKALAYYNAGIGNVSRKKVGESTLNYINKVLKNKQQFDDGLKIYLSENLDIINNN